MSEDISPGQQNNFPDFVNENERYMEELESQLTFTTVAFDHFVQHSAEREELRKGQLELNLANVKSLENDNAELRVKYEDSLAQIDSLTQELNAHANKNQDLQKCRIQCIQKLNGILGNKV